MNPKSALREALSLNPEDDILDTDEPDIFIVERKKIPGMDGFCTSIPIGKMEVYRVMGKNTINEESEHAPIATIEKYDIFVI